jgi:hypothetical protein
MIEQQRVYRIKDLDSLLGFLREDLCWDLPEASIDDVSFEWTGLDLNLSEDIHKKLKGGLIRQLQPFTTHQPWGIFIVEFAIREVSIITLRQILRCFIAKRRGARPDLPAWRCENLLFLCLYGENGFTFAHFKGDKPYSSKLTTFSWHPGEPIRTVCEFNLPALVYDYTWTPETWVEEWQKAFDVEKVNKDFYRQIARFYYRLTGKEGQKRELVLPYVGDDSGSISIYEEFAVRLIGRSIFCWFLKHKESANDIPLIPQEALSLAAARETKDFYHSMLEPLFFEVMNKRVNERKSLAIPRSETIPFLNGGLFEQHPNDFYTGTPNYGLKIPDAWFIDFFSLLERYNFTITENSSIDVDVAVDPEMLGRIFENLLAEVVPETGETARKATGSYYTPRAIVDYMVEQSLKQYLLTKAGLGEDKVNRLLEYGEDIEDFLPEEKLGAVTALREIKVIDPACGSGAFPMGILHRMLAVLEKVDPRLELWRAQYLKSLDGIVRQTVEKNISRENWAYIRKLMIIRDSIYGVDIQPIAVEIAKLRCFLSLVVDEIVLDNEENRGIEALPNLEFKFVAANTLIGLPQITDMGIMENMELIDELARLRKEYFGDSGANKERIKREFKAVQAQLSEHYRKLLITTKTDFTGATRKLDTKEATQSQLLAQWDPFSYKASIWFEPKWMFGVEGGFDIVIANPPYIQLSKVEGIAEWYKNYLRNRFHTSGGRLNTFIFFIHLGMDVLRNGGNLAYIIPNTILTQEYYSATREHLLKNNYLRTIVQYAGLPFENAVVENVTIIASKQKLSEYSIEILRDNLSEIELVDRKNNIEFLANRSFSISVNSDIVVDKVFSQYDSTLDTFCEVNQAIALKGDKKLSLKESNPDGKYYRLLDGRNIGKYSVTWGGVYLDYRLNRIHSCKRKDIFQSSEKLFFRRVSENLIFTYDDEQYFALNTLVVVNLKKDSSVKLKCLLAILNSRLMNYVYRGKFKSTKKVFSEIQARTVGALPIPDLDSRSQQSLIMLVDKILAAKKCDPQTDTRAFEAQIDQMVYELYGLTPEEIAVVEGS